MDSIEANADSSRKGRFDALVARCVEKIEAHFENEIDAVIEAHPRLERAIHDEHQRDPRWSISRRAPLLL